MPEISFADAVLPAGARIDLAPLHLRGARATTELLGHWQIYSLKKSRSTLFGVTTQNIRPQSLVYQLSVGTPRINPLTLNYSPRDYTASLGITYLQLFTPRLHSLLGDIRELRHAS